MAETPPTDVAPRLFELSEDLGAFAGASSNAELIDLQREASELADWFHQQAQDVIVSLTDNSPQAPLEVGEILDHGDSRVAQLYGAGYVQALRDSLVTAVQHLHRLNNRETPTSALVRKAVEDILASRNEFRNGDVVEHLRGKASTDAVSKVLRRMLAAGTLQTRDPEPDEDQRANFYFRPSTG